MPRKPSPPPKGKQKIMEKYTKLIMKRLYEQDIYVFFSDHLGMRWRGIFRDKKIEPFLIRDVPIWEKEPKYSVTYDGLLYTKDNLSPHAWNTIVHEVSHYEEGVHSVKVGKYLETHHSDSFNEIYKRNFKKVDDLRRQFNKEVGWDEDFVYDTASDSQPAFFY